MHRLLVVAIVFLASCANRTAPLAEYSRYNGSERQNLPGEYIAYLKQSRFTKGELDHLPAYAILFHGDPTRHFRVMGVKEREVTTIDLGTTDVSMMYVVRPSDGRTAFLVNRAQPGAGGTATQAAELAALGVKYVVHVGTSGLLGDRLNERQVVVAEGSYKDGGGQMLSAEPGERVSRPDGALSEMLKEKLRAGGTTSAVATGYTIPIYYFQSAGLVGALLGSKDFANPRPEYLEMEESPFFESARRTGMAAASLTVGSDRYVMGKNGQPVHTFLDDAEVTRSLGVALRATRGVFEDLDRGGGEEGR